MIKRKRRTREITEAEFDELSEGRDDTISLEYDEYTGVICENGYVNLDREDEDFIGRKFIDTLIDSGKEIAWGRNDETDTNYEFTRWNSKRSKPTD